MRFVALGIILLSLPLFIAWLQSGQKNRDIAMTLLGALVFVTGNLQVDAAFVTWPMWSGTSRGMLVAPSDMLALALLFTRKQSGKGLPLTTLMACYLGMLALSAIFSRNPTASMFSVWDFARVFLVFLAVGGELARPTAYPALLRGFSLGMMLQLGYVVEQKLSGVVQAAGTMNHQNLLGMMTELVFLNLLAAMLEGERSWLVRLGALSGAIIVAAGGSRGTMGLTGGAAVLLILVSLMRSRTSGKVAIAGAGAVILLAAVPIAMITLKDRFGDHSVFTEEEQRNAMERAARAVSADYPLGVGVNLYPTVASTEGYSQRAGVTWYGAGLSVPVHNAYLLIRAEAGYPGLAMFILLLVIPTMVGVGHAFRHRRKRSDGWPLGSAIAIGTIALHSYFEFNALVYFVQLPLAINIAIIAGRIRASRLEGIADPAHSRGAKGKGRGSQFGVARMPRVPSIGVVMQHDGTSANDGLPARTNKEIKR